MYFNLKTVVARYIPPRYHRYLRCVSDEWEKASPSSINIDEPRNIKNYSFFDICREGCEEYVLYAISKGINNWNQGLYNACYGGYSKIVQLMIEKGADDWDGGLINACISGHLELVQLMIEKGANNWNQGLYNACFSDNLEIVQLMIEKGASNVGIISNMFDFKPNIKQYFRNFCQTSV